MLFQQGSGLSRFNILCQIDVSGIWGSCHRWIIVLVIVIRISPTMHFFLLMSMGMSRLMSTTEYINKIISNDMK